MLFWQLFLDYFFFRKYDTTYDLIKHGYDIQMKTHTTHSFSHHLGQNLRKMRESRGHTQKEIAKILNVSFQQIQKYETGQNRLPIDKLLHLKHFYAVSFQTFFYGLIPHKDAEHRNKRFQHIHTQFLAIRDQNLKHRIYKIIEVMMEDRIHKDS